MKTMKLTCLAIFLCVASPVWASGYTKITADELQSMIKNEKNLHLFDARGGKYFDGVMIEGAKHFPANTVTAETLAQHIPSKDTPVVFYCMNVDCPAGELAARKAADAGYTEVYDYKGGIEEWKEKGLPITK